MTPIWPILKAARALRSHAPRAVINAAAYTAVDRAEGEEALATVINGDALPPWRGPVRRCRSRSLISRPITSLTGRAISLSRLITLQHRLGPMGAQNCKVKRACAGQGCACDPAHELGQLGAWDKFRQDHAASWCGAREPARGGRPDRRADPGSSDCRGLPAHGPEAGRPIGFVVLMCSAGKS